MCTQNTYVEECVNLLKTSVVPGLYSLFTFTAKCKRNTLQWVMKAVFCRLNKNVVVHFRTSKVLFTNGLTLGKENVYSKYQRSELRLILC